MSVDDRLKLKKLASNLKMLFDDFKNDGTTPKHQGGSTLRSSGRRPAVSCQLASDYMTLVTSLIPFARWAGERSSSAKTGGAKLLQRSPAGTNYKGWGGEAPPENQRNTYKTPTKH